MKKYLLYSFCLLLGAVGGCTRDEVENVKPAENTVIQPDGGRTEKEVANPYSYIPLKYMGSWNSIGVPNYLVSPFKPLDAGLLARFNASLPEGRSVKEHNPQFLAEGKKRNIVMKADGDLWITFIHEDAGWKNSLGYYTYPKNKKPHDIKDVKEITLIFPNSSEVNHGGGLRPGDRVKLGRFTKGTVIAFVMMARGWTENKLQGAYKLFTDPHLNPVHPNLKVHSVGLYDRPTDNIIVSFEDILRDKPNCDHDFNDTGFYITKVPANSVEIDNMEETKNPKK